MREGESAFSKTVSDRSLCNILSVAAWNDHTAVNIPLLREARQTAAGEWVALFDRIANYSTVSPIESMEVAASYAEFQVAQLCDDRRRESRGKANRRIGLDVGSWMSLLSNTDKADVDDRILGYAGVGDATEMIERGHASVLKFLSRGLTVDLVCWCHGDLHHENVLRNDRGLWLIDWDECYFGPYGGGVQLLLWEHSRESGEQYVSLLRSAASIFNHALPESMRSDEVVAMEQLISANAFTAMKEMLRMFERLRAKGGSRARAGAYLAAWGCRYELLFRAYLEY